MRPITVLLVALAASLTLPATVWAADPLPLRACSSGKADRTRCGTLRVPLDRTGAVAGVVNLRVRLLDPVRGAPKATVIALAGGPGQAATPLLEAFAERLGSAAAGRRIVTFDQRGTGRSGRLRCGEDRDQRLTSMADAVSRCAAEIGPRRTAYTTMASVDDLEAVRAALGAEQVVLLGTSYGTKVALDYAAAYPERVERLVLDSVVPPHGGDPFMRPTLGSIERVFASVCAGGGCPFTRSVTADLAALVRQLADRPLWGTLIGPDGRGRRVGMNRSSLLLAVLATDRDPIARLALPGALAAARRGDNAPLVRSLAGLLSAEPQRGDSDALFLATTCQDGAVAWPAGTPMADRRAAVNAAAAAIPDRAFAPFDRASVRGTTLVDLCRGWPESPIAQRTAPLPDVPTLILSGDDDLRTPRADAHAVAEQLPRAIVLHIPNTGHDALGSDDSGCAVAGAAAFLDGRVPASCRQRRRVMTPIPLPPASLRALRPIGASGARGRTVAAVLRTYGDAINQSLGALLRGDRAMRLGGLRGGTIAADRDGALHLRRYSYIPGVTVSGVVEAEARALVFTVGGSAAVPGKLTISRRGVVGELGGETVRVPARALGAAASAAVASARPTTLTGCRRLTFSEPC